VTIGAVDERLSIRQNPHMPHLFSALLVAIASMLGHALAATVRDDAPGR